MYDGVMDTQTKFADGDLVEYVGRSFQGLLNGLQGNLVQQVNAPVGGFPWRLILTPEAQATYFNVDARLVVPGTAWERDRQSGWLVLEDEIRKVEG